MIVKTKHGIVFCDIYRDTEGISKDVRFFRIIATNKDGCEMGHLNFELQDGGRVWLFHIATEEVFWHQGTGQAMLDVFESFCLTNGHRSIEGRFCPENDYAEDFYKKNGYSIYEDSYRYYVSTYLMPKKIHEEVMSRIDGDFVVKDYKVYKKQKEEREKLVWDLSTRQEEKHAQKQQKIAQIVENAKKTCKTNEKSSFQKSY